jgi:hypothetical protein
MQHICNNCWNIFNAILHNPITSHLTFVSWILMVKNKIINFILNHPFYYNRFRFLNGKKKKSWTHFQCVSFKIFQWYK